MEVVMTLLNKQYALVNPTEDDKQKFHSKTKQLLKRKQSESFFHEVFSILKIILSVNEFPKDKVLGSTMTIIALQNILSNIRSNNVKLKVFCSDLLELFLICLKAGPSVGHLEVMKHLLSMEELKDHIKHCKGQELQRIIITLTKTFSKCEGSQNRLVYTELFHDVILKMFIKESLCYEQLLSEKEKLLDLYHFYLEQHSGEAADLHCAVIMEFKSHFQDKPSLYKGLTTDTIIIKHLESIQAVTMNDNQSIFNGKIILEVLRNILEAMKDNKLAWKKLFLNFMDMLFELLSKHTHLSHNICCMLVKSLKDDAVIEIKDKLEVCQKYVCKLTHAILTKHCKQDRLLQEIADFMFQRLVEPYVTPPLSYSLVELLIACLCQGSNYFMKAALWLVHAENIIKWEDNPTLCVRVVLQLRKIPNKYKKVLNLYSQFTSLLFTQFRNLGVLQYIENLLPQIVLKACENSNQSYYIAIAEHIIDLVEWQKAGAVVSQILSAIDVLLRENVEATRDSSCQALTLRIIDKVLEYLKVTSNGEGFVGILHKIFSVCLQHYHKEDPKNEQSMYAMMADKILDLYCLQNLHNEKVITIFLLDLLDICIKKDERYLPSSLNLLQTLDNNVELLQPHIKLILSGVLDKGTTDFIAYLVPLYSFDPPEFEERIKDIIDLLDDLTDEEQNSTYALIELITKNKPEIVIKHLPALQLKLTNLNTDSANLRIQEILASVYSDLFVSHMSFYLKFMNGNQLQVHSCLNILKSIAVTSNDTACSVINSLAELVSTFDMLFQPLLLKAMKDIGERYPNALFRQRPLLESLSEYDHLEEMCVFVLGFLDGITQKEFNEEILKRKASLKEQTDKENEALEKSTSPPVFISYSAEFETKVECFKRHLEMAGYTTSTEINQTKVKAQNIEISKDSDYKNMKSAQVIILCVTLQFAESTKCIQDVTVAKDLGKPMIPVLLEDVPWPPKGTLAPIVSELFYIQFYSNHSTNEDIQKDSYWSNSKFLELLVQVRYYVAPIETQISEEYRYWTQTIDETHSFSEYNKDRRISASQPYGPVTVNQSSSLIYLSYSWDKQNQIKTLYWQLTNLGFSCWLDLNNLKGKESLNHKIQKALQEAGIIICCVTSKYFLYPKCQAEIILVADMKKPIIPLLLEKVQWSSNDILHQVFSTLPYIEFTDQEDKMNPWIGKKFNTLIHELNLSIHESSDESDDDDEDTFLDESFDDENWSLETSGRRKSSLSNISDIVTPRQEARDVFCCTIL